MGTHGWHGRYNLFYLAGHSESPWIPQAPTFHLSKAVGNAWLSWPYSVFFSATTFTWSLHPLLQDYTFTVNMIRVSVNDLWVLLLVSVWVYLLVHMYVVGGKVASWLVHSTLDQVVQVKALARKIELCCWARHFTLSVPLSTQVCKWVSAHLVLEVTLQ